MSGLSFRCQCPIRRKAPFGPEAAEAARKGPKDPKERRHWEPGIQALPHRLAPGSLPFSLQPERVMAVLYAKAAPPQAQTNIPRATLTRADALA